MTKATYFNRHPTIVLGLLTAFIAVVVIPLSLFARLPLIALRRTRLAA